MSNSKKSLKKYQVNLRDFIKVFINRKWWFVGTFTIVLLAGLLFIFLNTPMYRSDSIIKSLDNYYNNDIYEYFPSEALDLWIIPINIDIEDFEDKKLSDISAGLKSDEILDEIIDNLDFEITKTKLNEVIDTYIDKAGKVVRVVTISEDPMLSYKVNDLLIGTYTENKNIESREKYNELISKIDEEISLVSKEVTESGQGSQNEILNTLEEMKYNLEKNSEFFLTRVEIVSEPEISQNPFNFNYLRNIIISIIAAIALALIVVYIPSLFTPIKK